MENIKTNSENRTVHLNFNPLLYSEEAINQATKDFKEICSVTRKDNVHSFVLKVTDDDINISTVGNEFFNYVLGIMQGSLSNESKNI